MWFSWHPFVNTDANIKGHPRSRLFRPATEIEPYSFRVRMPISKFYPLEKSMNINISLLTGLNISIVTQSHCYRNTINFVEICGNLLTKMEVIPEGGLIAFESPTNSSVNIEQKAF